MKSWQICNKFYVIACKFETFSVRTLAFIQNLNSAHNCAVTRTKSVLAYTVRPRCTFCEEIIEFLLDISEIFLMIIMMMMMKVSVEQTKIDTKSCESCG